MPHAIVPIHLTFLDGALDALVEALALYESQLKLMPAARDAYKVSRAIETTHLSVERLLKHIVASVDPYLLLANPRPELLRNLRKVLIRDQAPTIFASGVFFETIDPIQLAKLLQDVTHPEIDEQFFDSFLESFA